MSWTVEGETVNVTANAPEGVVLRFVRNDTHDGLNVVFNGTPVK